MAETFRATVIGPFTVVLSPRALIGGGFPEVACPVQLANGRIVACFWGKWQEYRLISADLMRSGITVQWESEEQDCVEAVDFF